MILFIVIFKLKNGLLELSYPQSSLAAVPP